MGRSLHFYQSGHRDEYLRIFEPLNLILNNLSHQFAFRNYVAVNISGPFHLHNTAANGGSENELENHSVAGNHFSFKLYSIYFYEISAPKFGFLHIVQREYTTHLGHGFNLQYTRHNRISRKVTLEKRFVNRYVFNSHHVIVV